MSSVSPAWAEGTDRTIDPTFPEIWMSRTTVSPTGHLIQTSPLSLPHSTPVPHSPQQVLPLYNGPTVPLQVLPLTPRPLFFVLLLSSESKCIQVLN